MKPGVKMMSAGTFAVLSMLAIIFLPADKAQLTMLTLIGFSLFYLLLQFFFSRPRAVVPQDKAPRQRKLKRNRKEGKQQAPNRRAELLENPIPAGAAEKIVEENVQAAPVPMVVPEVATEYKVTMQKHINCRITEKLQAAFPDATWRWNSDNPLEIAMSGGEAKIHTYGAGDFNKAEVLFLPNGRIRLNMVTSMPLGNVGRGPAPAKEQPIEKDPDSLNLQDWYEVSASPVIRATIDEVFTRGHKRLYIAENGDVFVEEDKSQVKQGKLPFVPSKKLWNELVPLFADDDITMAVEDSRMALTWAD